MKRKPFVFAVIVLAVIVVIGFSVFTGFASTLFNIAMGNEVYAFVINETPYIKDSFGNLGITITLDMVKTRTPIETALTGYKIDDVAPASFNDSTFSLTLWVTGSVANDINTYGHTFQFYDGASHVLTCYLHDYDASRYPSITMSVYGVFSYEGLQFNLGP